MPFQIGQLVVTDDVRQLRALAVRTTGPQVFRITAIDSWDPTLFVRLVTNESLGGWASECHFRPYGVELRRTYCADCSALIRDAPYFREDALCDECGVECEECHRRCLARETVAIGYDRDREWCSDCVSRRAFTCGNCEEVTANSLRASCDSSCGTICEECRDSDHHYCDSCEETYCSGHERCGSDIHGYGYKPYAEFRGTGPRYLGMELEISAEAYLSRTVAEMAGGLIYCKADSSIDSGFEMVSHPMTFDWAVTNNGYPFGMLDTLKREGAYPDGSCGMHIHISRAAFADDAHCRRWFLLFYRNKDAVTAFSRREEENLNEWASLNAGDSSDSIRAAAVKEGGGYGNGRARYTCINAQNTETFEVRVFASTLDPDTVRASLGLVDASCVYTGEIGQDDFRSGGWHWDAFAAWVDTRPEYAALAAEMRTLGTLGIGRNQTRPDAIVERLCTPVAPLVAPTAAELRNRTSDASLGLVSAFEHGHPCGCGCGLVWSLRSGRWVESHNLGPDPRTPASSFGDLAELASDEEFAF